MPVDIASLLQPSSCALLMMECQEGVIGESGYGDLPDAVRRHGTVARIAALLARARSLGIPVFHLLAARRADHGGSSANCRLFARGRRGEPLLLDSPRQRPIAALAPAADDYVLTRYHGVSPFHDSELDALLRNLGVRTVIATGVSINVALTGLTIEAVNRGYQVVLPRDAVAGTPDDYVDAVFRNTLAFLATETTSAAILATWDGDGAASSGQ